MRISLDIHPQYIDDPLARKFWEVVKGNFHELSLGLASVVPPGNTPDIIQYINENLDLADYLYKPGRVGGQTIFATGVGDNIVVVRGENAGVGHTGDYFRAEAANGDPQFRVLRNASYNELHLGGSAETYRLLIRGGGSSGDAELRALSILIGSGDSTTGSVRVSAKNFILSGSVSGNLTLQCAPTTATFTMVLPPAVGTGALYSTAGALSYVATMPPGAHTHPWSDITSTPTTIAGYGITDFNSLGDARWLTLAAAAGYVTIAGNETITGLKTIIYSGAGTGFIIKQGASQAATDKLLSLQNVAGSERGYFTLDYGGLGRSGLSLYHDLWLGASGTASYGTVNMWGSSGGLVTLRPATSGTGTADIIIPMINRTAYLVTSTNQLSAVGTIAVVGNGADPSTGVSPNYISVVNRTGQVANVSAPILLTSGSPAGFYQVNVYMECASAGTGTVTFNLTHTDAVGSKTAGFAGLSMAATTNVGTGTRLIYLASGNISWGTSGYTSGTYNVRVRLTYLGA